MLYVIKKQLTVIKGGKDLIIFESPCCFKPDAEKYVTAEC